MFFSNRIFKNKGSLPWIFNTFCKYTRQEWNFQQTVGSPLHFKIGSGLPKIMTDILPYFSKFCRYLAFTKHQISNNTEL